MAFAKGRRHATLPSVADREITPVGRANQRPFDSVLVNRRGMVHPARWGTSTGSLSLS